MKVKRNIILILILTGILLIFKAKVLAGSLSCVIRTSSCNNGEVVIFKISDISNGHAELPGQSNYSQFVCCGGPSGLGNNCAGTYSKVLNLSAVTNAHVEEGTQTNYATTVCISVPTGLGTTTVGYKANNCSGYDTTLASMSGVTNAHVGASSTFVNIQICASATSTASITCTTPLDGQTVTFGTIDPNSVYAASPSVTTTITSNLPMYFQVADQGGKTLESSYWVIATDTPDTGIYGLTYDSYNKVVYAGSSANYGYILRCDASTTSCGPSNWTIATSTPAETQISSLIYDSYNKVIYAGGSSNSVLLRCDASTTYCGSSNWTEVSGGTMGSIGGFTFDSFNKAIYYGYTNGMGTGVVYRCNASTTSCANSSNWTSVFTSGFGFFALTFDSFNHVVYAADSQTIYNCSSSCDNSSNWTTATTVNAIARSLTYDSNKKTIYVGISGGHIYRCDASATYCGSSDWTTATDTPEADIYSLTYDSYNKIVYAGSGDSGFIYYCNASSTSCGPSNWTIATDTLENQIHSLTYDSFNNAIYAGSSASGYIFQRSNANGVASPGLFKNPYLIESPNTSFSATSTLIAGTEGYGLLATTTSANIIINSRYLWPTTSPTVGGLTASSSFTTVASSSSAVSGQVVTNILKAAVANNTPNGSYSDIIYLQCSASP